MSNESLSRACASWISAANEACDIDFKALFRGQKFLYHPDRVRSRSAKALNEQVFKLFGGLQDDLVDPFFDSAKGSPVEYEAWKGFYTKESSACQMYVQFTKRLSDAESDNM